MKAPVNSPWVFLLIFRASLECESSFAQRVGEMDMNLIIVLEYVKRLLSTTKVIDTIEFSLLDTRTESVTGAKDWYIPFDLNIVRVVKATSKIADILRPVPFILKRTRQVFNVVMVKGPSEGFLSVPWTNASNPYHYYLFYQLNSNSKPLLNTSPVYNLKYKVELVVQGELQVLSLCFYCNGGYPLLLTLPTNASFQTTFPVYTNHVNGTTLKVTSSRGNSRSMKYKDLPNGSVVFDGGSANNVLFDLQRRFGFKYEFALSNGFGLLLPNGTFTGIIGGLSRGEYDIGIEAGIKSERFAATEYLPLTTFESLTFLTRTPQSEPRWGLIYAPLTRQTWTALGCAINILILAFSCLKMTSGHMMRKKTNTVKSALKGCEFLVSTLMEQSRDVRFQKEQQSYRLAAMAWLLPLIALLTAYKAKLTTLMTYPAVEKVPANFDELASSDYNIYLHAYGGGLPEFIFRTTTNPKLVYIRNRMVKEASLLKCVENVVKTKAACITLGSNGMFEAMKNFSDISGNVLVMKAPVNLYPFLPGGPVLKKGQPFAKEFATTIRTMLDMGLTLKHQDDVDRIQSIKGRRWARSRISKEPWRLPQKDMVQPMEMQEIIGVLLVVAGLIMTSFLVLLLERMRPRVHSCVSEVLHKRWKKEHLVLVE